MVSVWCVSVCLCDMHVKCVCDMWCVVCSVWFVCGFGMCGICVVCLWSVCCICEMWSLCVMCVVCVCDMIYAVCVCGV